MVLLRIIGQATCLPVSCTTTTLPLCSSPVPVEVPCVSLELEIEADRKGMPSVLASLGSLTG